MKSIRPSVSAPEASSVLCGGGQTTGGARRARLASFGIAGLLAVSTMTACSNDVLSSSSAPALEIDGKTALTKAQLKAQLALYASNEVFMRAVQQPLLPKGSTRYPADLTAAILDRRLFVAVIEAATTSLKLKAAPDPADLAERAAQLAFSLQQPDPAAPAEFAKLPEADQELFKQAARGVDSLNTWIGTALDAEITKLGGTPKEFFEKNKALFPSASCIRHVLVDDEATANKVRERLVGGESWATVAKDSKDPGSGANAGELGCNPTDGYVPEFKAAADAAKIGEITQPVKSQFGFHVIEVTKRDESKFDETQVKQAMQQQFGPQAQPLVAPKLFGPMNKLKVTVSPEFGVVRPGGETGFPTILAPGAAKAADAAAGQGRVEEAETAPAPQQ
jgi:parvulin-like peptidyl-prolyl isomerase